MLNTEIKLIDPGDKKLKQISTKVTDFENPIYQEMLKEMENICIKGKAYASAAPQFGILKRFILIMTVNELRVENELELENLKIEYVTKPYFNPVITKMIGKQYFYESCMSVENATGKVARPYKIEIEYQDINGNKFIKEVEGFEAIIFCHEINHLDGIEYTDIAEIMYYDIDTNNRLKIRQEYPHEIVNEDEPFSYIKTRQLIKKI